MTKKEAYELIDSILVQLKMTREDHMKCMGALQILMAEPQAEAKAELKAVPEKK